MCNEAGKEREITDVLCNNEMTSLPNADISSFTYAFLLLCQVGEHQHQLAHPCSNR